jgi:hypothetical protein
MESIPELVLALYWSTRGQSWWRTCRKSVRAPACSFVVRRKFWGAETVQGTQRVPDGVKTVQPLVENGCLGQDPGAR